MLAVKPINIKGTEISLAKCMLDLHVVLLSKEGITLKPLASCS